MTKFVSHMAGYFIFIAALFLHNYLDYRNGNRGPPNTGVELYIVLFVVGKWLTSLKNMWTYGYQVNIRLILLVVLILHPILFFFIFIYMYLFICIRQQSPQTS